MGRAAAFALLLMTTADAAHAGLLQLAITGASGVDVGQAIPLGLTGFYSDQPFSRDIPTNEAIWSIVNGPDIASVDATGVVTGLSAGTATIEATFDDVAATVSVPVLAGPELFTLSPAQSNLAGGIIVVALGNRFSPGDIITVGGLAGTSVKFLSANQLAFTVPPAPDFAPGFVDVKIINPADNSSFTLANGFRYVPEPSTLVLGIAGLAGLGLVALRKKYRRV